MLDAGVLFRGTMLRMAKGFIPESEIQYVRDHVRIDEVVGEYVQLTPAGADSLKGLSPFKDEKTPSFFVRPNKGYYHCFSTDQGGDVFSFLQEMEGITFPEAVEECARRIGHQLRYEGGGSTRQEESGTRHRLVAVNEEAAKFYAEQLLTPDAAPAREFLKDRGFTREHAEKFGCGFAPLAWDSLTKHLLKKGFQISELYAAGVSTQGKRGAIDRFRRRLIWPIRNTSREVIGFGARKLFDDDNLGKYLNTAETPLYKKSKVLFGLDLARRDIARSHEVIVVEGYTDVMALHAAGITNVVAACGTAFGHEHLLVLRRLMANSETQSGRIIYTFDGDEAGLNAARRAFDGSQDFLGECDIAIAPGGKDPCDLWKEDRSGAALRGLFSDAHRQRLAWFVLNKEMGDIDNVTWEGKNEAVAKAARVLAKISSDSVRQGYLSEVARWVQVQPSVVKSAVHAVQREIAAKKEQDRAREQRRQRALAEQQGHGASSGSQRHGSAGQGAYRDGRGVQGSGVQGGAGHGAYSGGGVQGVRSGGYAGQGGGHGASASHGQNPDVSSVPSGFAGTGRDSERLGSVRDVPRPASNDPRLSIEREALKVVLQAGYAVHPQWFRRLDPKFCFTHPLFVQAARAIEAVGDLGTPRASEAAWFEQVQAAMPTEQGKLLVQELFVEPMHTDAREGEAMQTYAEGMLAKLMIRWVDRVIEGVHGDMRREEPTMGAGKSEQILHDLMGLDAYRRALERVVTAQD